VQQVEEGEVWVKILIRTRRGKSPRVRGLTSSRHRIRVAVFRERSSEIETDGHRSSAVNPAGHHRLRAGRRLSRRYLARARRGRHCSKR
jgi:hypothetical protein